MLIAAAAACAIAALCSATNVWAAKTKISLGSGSPQVLLFPLQGDKPAAQTATAAVKANLRQGESILVTEFRPDLPSLNRAVMESSLTKTDLKADDDVSKLRIAKYLNASFYIEGEYTQTSETASIQMTATEVHSGRKYPFSSDARLTGANSPRGADTLVLSVANTVVTQFMQQVLGTMPPAAPAIVNTTPEPAAAAATPPPAAEAAQPAGKQADQTPATAPATPDPPAPAPAPVVPNADATSYVAQSEALAGSGDLAGAIQALRQAVNIQPEDVSLRLKLAELYTRKGMPDEAASEMQRAVSLAPRDASSREALAKQLQAAGSVAEARKLYEDLLKENPQDTEVRLALGDLLWNSGKPDDAALEYAQASNEAPQAPAPHERLARLYASRMQFQEALGQVSTIRDLKKLDDQTPVEIGLYKSLVQNADVAFYKQRQLQDSAERDFEAGKLTRENYYDKAKAMLTDIEELAEFYGELIPPADFAKSHLHRTLAGSLLAQAATSLQDWLIRNDEGQKNDYERFVREPEKEMETATGIDSQFRTGG